VLQIVPADRAAGARTITSTVGRPRERRRAASAWCDDRRRVLCGGSRWARVISTQWRVSPGMSQRSGAILSLESSLVRSARDLTPELSE